MKDYAAYKAAVRAYNDWLAEEYCPVAPDPPTWDGCVIPWTNIDDALAELTHFAKGVERCLVGRLSQRQGLPTAEDDRFWAAARRSTCRDCHVGFNATVPAPASPCSWFPNQIPEVFLKSTRISWDYVARWGMDAAKTMSPLILSGVF